MCGIAGMVRRDGPVADAELQRMAGCMTHRGPEDSGSYVAGKISGLTIGGDDIPSELELGSKGAAVDLIISDAQFIVDAGATATGTVLSSTTPTLEESEISGVVISTTLGFEAEQTIETGGVGSATVVQSGGLEAVASGGVVSSGLRQPGLPPGRANPLQRP